MERLLGTLETISKPIPLTLTAEQSTLQPVLKSEALLNSTEANAETNKQIDANSTAQYMSTPVKDPHLYYKPKECWAPMKPKVRVKAKTNF